MSEHRITFTYLNIRQSITILLTKLITADILLAGIVIGFYWVLVSGKDFLGIEFDSDYLFLGIFGFIGLIKIWISIYVVLQWLNDYYEITPDYIYHKKGIIFRRTEQYKIDHIRRIDVQDTFLGELFNFATVSLYDIRLNKYLDLYLIHNPQRYAHILKELNPNIEAESDRVRLPFMPKKDERFDKYLAEGGD